MIHALGHIIEYLGLSSGPSTWMTMAQGVGCCCFFLDPPTSPSSIVPHMAYGLYTKFNHTSISQPHLMLICRALINFVEGPRVGAVTLEGQSKGRADTR